LIVSDEAIPRSALRQLFNSERGFEVIAECSSKSVLLQGRKYKPDVVILHIVALRQNVVDLIGSIHSAFPRAGILILGRDTHQATLALMLGAGALGYVLLRSTPRELFTAVRAIAHGRRFIDPNLSDEYIDLFLRHTVKGSKLLSAREQQVLLMLARGHSVKEIAHRLSVSRKSVETYQSRMREKLNLRSRADIVRYALESGLLTREHSMEPT
jgi:two-component system response regulator NreC